MKARLHEYPGQSKQSAARDYALGLFNPTPVGDVKPVDFIGEYRKNILTVDKVMALKTPLGRTIQEELIEIEKNDLARGTAIRTAINKIMDREAELDAAEKKYQAALKALNADKSIPYPKLQKEIAKIYADFEAELNQIVDQQKTDLDAIFTADKANIQRDFNLASDKDFDAFKKTFVDAIDSGHKEALAAANKLSKGDEERDKEFAKNLQQLQVLAGLYAHKENHELIEAAIVTAEKAGKIPQSSSSLVSTKGTIDPNLLQYITVQDVYNELKKATLEKSYFSKKPGLLVGPRKLQSPWGILQDPRYPIPFPGSSASLLEYDPSTDSVSIALPGFQINTKFSGLISIKALDTFGLFTPSDDELMETLAEELAFLKAIKDDVSFDVSAVDEKEALRLCRLAYKEATAQGFEEKNITFTITTKGKTKTVSAEDVFKGHGNARQQYRAAAEAADQERHEAAAMLTKDYKAYMKKLPGREWPKEKDPKDEKKEGEEKKQQGP